MLDALARIERQLVDAAAQQQAQAPRPAARPAQWRPPRAVLVALILLALASGASAVTGVGPVGELFEPEKSGLAPESGAPSTTVTQRTASGEEVSMRAYENNEGALCVQSPPVEDPPSGVTTFNCGPPPAVAAELERGGAFAAINADGPRIAFYGLVRADVADLQVAADGAAPVQAELADETIDGYRAFLAVLDGPVPSLADPVTLIFDQGQRERWPPSR